MVITLYLQGGDRLLRRNRAFIAPRQAKCNPFFRRMTFVCASGSSAASKRRNLQKLIHRTLRILCECFAIEAADPSAARRLANASVPLGAAICCFDRL
jgi:hypothetical protein